MNLKVLIIVLTIFFSSLFANTNKQINEYLRNIEKNYLQHKSISYRVVYKIKSLMAKNVEQVIAEVELIRKESDKNFGAIIWYKLGDTVEKYYSGSGLFSINHKNKSITTFNIDAGEIDGIIQDIDGDVIRIPFSNPKMITGLDDGFNKLSIRNHPYTSKLKQILVKYPNEKNFENAEMEITFDPKTYEITKIYSKFKFRGELQTNEWNLYNVQYDKVTEQDLSKRFAKYKSYKRVKFEKPKHQFIEQSN